jgi:hypothetical protein
MINLKKAVKGLTLGLTLLSFQAHSHNPINQRVKLEPITTGEFQAGKITYQFKLIDSKTNDVITDKNLAIDHEKILHLFLFDPALIEFRHIHPTFNGNLWTVDTEINVNGNYWVWAQGKLATDQTEFTSSNRQSIEGGFPENVVAALNDIRSGNDSGSVVSLSSEIFSPKQMVMPMLKFSRADGSSPILSDYLGAKAHIIIVPSSGDSLIHVHPMAAGMNQLMIHTEFPQGGHYRVWVQFIDGGKLKVVPLSVIVND